MSNGNILVVEDDPVVMRVLESQLRANGYEVVGAANSTAAILAAQTTTPDLMILDLSLIDDDPFNAIRDGFGVLGWVRRTLPDAKFPVIIHTANDSPGVEVNARANGVYGVFRKGDDLSGLLAAVRQALSQGTNEEPVSN